MLKKILLMSVCSVGFFLSLPIQASSVATCRDASFGSISNYYCFYTDFPHDQSTSMWVVNYYKYKQYFTVSNNCKDSDQEHLNAEPAKSTLLDDCQRGGGTYVTFP